MFIKRRKRNKKKSTPSQKPAHRGKIMFLESLWELHVLRQLMEESWRFLEIVETGLEFVLRFVTCRV